MHNTEKVLKKISNSKPLPIVGEIKGELVEQLVQKYKPKRVLEIGTLVGYSAIMIIRNLPPTGRLTTIEIDPEVAVIAQRNLNDAGVAEKVEIITGDARSIIPTLTKKFDFVFIDAEKKQYLSYLNLLQQYNLLEDKAVILADNVKIFAAKMKDYLDYVRTSGKFKSNYHDFGDDGMEVSQLL